jgi:hypothetical protein
MHNGKQPEDLKVTELKHFLTSKGKSTKGKKNDLIKRLIPSSWHLTQFTEVSVILLE